MHSEITRGQSEPLGQRTFTARNRFVLALSHSVYPLNNSFQGEQEHRTVKRIFPRTSKRGYAEQIAKRERRIRILRAIRERNERIKERGHSLRGNTDGPPVVPNHPERHHLISDGKNHMLKLVDWLAESRGDPALKVILLAFEFLPRPSHGCGLGF